MSARGRSAALPLIGQLLTLAGPGADLVEATEREWASATFAGARHIITLKVLVAASGSPAPPWITTIGEHGFTLPRAFVADAIATAEPPAQDDGGHWTRRCTIELLTVDDDIN
jgi:hypothetical protein